MKFLLFSFFVCCVATVAIAYTEQESKFQEIIQLLNNSEQQLKAEAQTYSASLAANPGNFQQGSFSRASERSRYTSAQPSNVALDEEEARRLAEEEEEKKPDRLALLLAESKFTCDSLKNGYYADETVGCQVFHYCIDGVKHSWQCPENTVFHQIHLNCVPNTQDICQQSSKYHIVNEYLHKELDERGPNNTVLYHQRFYPDGFDYSGGDPVAQIFQAQAQAALLKAQQRQRQPQPVDDDDDDDRHHHQPIQPRTRTRSRQQHHQAQAQFHALPQSQPQVRAQPQSNHIPSSRDSKPLYRQQVGRQLVSYQPPPQAQPKPTPRPSLSFTSAPETFAPPTYTETPREDDFNTNDFTHTSHADQSSASLQSGFAPSNSISPSSFQVPSTTSFAAPSSPSSFAPSSGSSTGYTATGSSSSFNTGSSSPSSSSSSSSFSPSTTSTSGYRSTSSSSRTSSATGGYPTRSLGIPIASFRVAPASSFAPSSSPSAQASTLQEVNVAPMLHFSTLSDQDENRPVLSHLFY